MAVCTHKEQILCSTFASSSVNSASTMLTSTRLSSCQNGHQSQHNLNMRCMAFGLIGMAENANRHDTRHMHNITNYM